MRRFVALLVLVPFVVPSAATASDSGTITRWLTRAQGSDLHLVRSFALPADHRLADWAWTYDSAVAAAAFVASGQEPRARALLDQLADLQRRDGSISLAFDVENGDDSPHVRAGTVAWLGLAFATYDRTYDSTRYASEAGAAADYLLTLRRPDGLIGGGPDVRWASTEHNVAAYTLFTKLPGYGDAAAALASAIDASLIVRTGDSAWVRQGAGDDGQAIDAQTLGAMFLAGRGDFATANEVLANASGVFGRGAPLAGFEPYAGPGAPDVLWFEGLAQMRLATAMVGGDTSALDAAMDQAWAPTRDQGLPPRQATGTDTGSRFGDYHPWPAAAAGAWVILSHTQGERLLVAPASAG